jgi:cytochrome c-type biogenesis protein CcmH/NrfG
MLNIAVLAPKSPWMHELIAQEMARQNNTEGAITHYREALRIDNRIPGIRFELAEALSESSSPADKEQAEKEYQAAVAQNPFDEKSECRLGKIAFGRSDLKDAFAHYSRALALQPDDPEANLGLGTILLSMDQPKKAQPLLESAVRLDPSDPVAHYRLRSLYQKVGNAEEARRELAKYRQFKQMKEQLKSLYREMRLETRPAQIEPDIPQ